MEKHLYNLQQIKEALVATYAKDICQQGKDDINACETIADLVTIYKYYQQTLVGELSIPASFFRTYLKDYREDLEQQGIYVDREFVRVNPTTETIILIGKCKLRLFKSQTNYHKIIALHDSQVTTVLMDYSVCDIFIADKSRIKLGYINEQARLTINCKKEIVTYPHNK